MEGDKIDLQGFTAPLLVTLRTPNLIALFALNHSVCNVQFFQDALTEQGGCGLQRPIRAGCNIGVDNGDPL